MTNLLVQPTKLQGEIRIPPSKSMAHRAVIAASLAEGESHIANVQLSDDILATITGMEAFGADIKTEEVDERVHLKIQGINPEAFTQKNQASREIDANESGSTLRFLLPLATLFQEKTMFQRRGKLATRPLDVYANIFDEKNISYDFPKQVLSPATVQGQLPAGKYKMPGNISSQFITGLLYTLPLLSGDSRIEITTPLESVGYIDLTLEVLKTFGIDIHFDRQTNCFEIPGKQKYQSKDYTVEGDYSQAAFFICAGALGNDVKLVGLNPDSKQGDRGIIEMVEALGAQVEITEEYIQARASHLQGNVSLDGAQVPDVIPVLSVVAALADGKTKIENLERLRIKESDRLDASRDLINLLGGQATVENEGLVIEGVEQLTGGVGVWSYKDHRMAMMMAIASTVCKKDIIIKDAEVVAKSYPTFWQDFQALGGKISEWNMGK